MDTGERSSRFVSVLLRAGIVGGLLLAVDAVVLDLAFEDSTLARVAGVLVAPLGLLGLVGLYFTVGKRVACRHLDLGFMFNVVGFCAVAAISFSRNFILSPASDETLDAIRDAFPVVPALIFAGVAASVGFIAFGSALLRHGADRVSSWGYTVLLPASGFAAQMPAAVAAVVQGLAGAAVVWLVVTELRKLAPAPSLAR